VREEADQDDDGERNSEQKQENRAHVFSPLGVYDFRAKTFFERTAICDACYAARITGR
jgi:hypothetical protein